MEIARPHPGMAPKPGSSADHHFGAPERNQPATGQACFATASCHTLVLKGAWISASADGVDPRPI